MLPKQLKDSQRHQRQPKQVELFLQSALVILRFCSSIVKLEVGVLIINQVFTEIVFRWWSGYIWVADPLLLVETIDNRFPKIEGLFAGRWRTDRIFINVLILLIGSLESQNRKYSAKIIQAALAVFDVLGCL